MDPLCLILGLGGRVFLVFSLRVVLHEWRGIFWEGGGFLFFFCFWTCLCCFCLRIMASLKASTRKKGIVF